MNPNQVRTVDSNERVLPSAHVDWALKAEAVTGAAPWVPNAAGHSGSGGSLRKGSHKKGGVTSTGLAHWKTKADGKAALRQAGVYDSSVELSP